MAKLVYIEASPRKQRSYSIEVAKASLDAHAVQHPQDTIEKSGSMGRRVSFVLTALRADRGGGL